MHSLFYKGIGDPDPIIDAALEAKGFKASFFIEKNREFWNEENDLELIFETEQDAIMFELRHN